jgi:predicted nuclease of predicted toxin-antitoxin system
MRFLIDANLPRSAVGVLERFGHQVEFARDIVLAAATDEQVATHALKSNAAILTRDLDFADIRRYPPDRYYGIVVLRLPDSAIAQEKHVTPI